MAKKNLFFQSAWETGPTLFSWLTFPNIWTMYCMWVSKKTEFTPHCHGFCAFSSHSHLDIGAIGSSQLVVWTSPMLESSLSLFVRECRFLKPMLFIPTKKNHLKSWNRLLHLNLISFQRPQSTLVSSLALHMPDVMQFWLALSLPFRWASRVFTRPVSWWIQWIWVRIMLEL